MKPMSAGRPPKGRRIGIIAVAKPDNDGALLDPPEYEYWVVVFGSSPIEVLSTGHPTYRNAVEWLAEQGLRLGDTPS